jgi:signal transduction histidine kinase
MSRNCLILTQYREGDEYNDFIGKFYHFPVNNQKNYLRQFENLPIEFVYYEPEKHGAGIYYGYGKISKPPFADKKNNGFYYVEIDDYRAFEKPVYYKNDGNEVLEKIFNAEYYNSSNSVRKIYDKFLDALCLDGGITLHLESDAHLIRVLGEQLIGSEKIGILELIKNSIDAGSSYCRVRIENIPALLVSDNYEYPDLPGPVIIIEDDGSGMSKEIIEHGWLRPASPIKTIEKERLKKERENAIASNSLGAYDAIVKQLKKEKGRLPLGEKGVGRFATHRLGRFLEVRTKVSNIPYELVLKIDWDEFDRLDNGFRNLNSIGVFLYRSEPTRNYGKKNSGTKIIISGGRDGFQWSEKIICELNRSILNLKSPSTEHFRKLKLEYPIFTPIFECPQLERELPQNLIYEDSNPNFELDVLVNEQGIAEDYELRFKHPHEKLPSENFKGENLDLRYPIENMPYNYWFNDNNEKRDPECGAFYLSLKSWYRKAEWIDIADWKELTEYLDEYGGMSIYRDGILVVDSKLSSEFDWLGLNAEHIKKGEKISYRDFIGIVETNQFDNFRLIDKTNREGLIENTAANDLAVLLKNIISKILFQKYKEKRNLMSSLSKGIVSNPSILSNLAKTSSTFFTNVSSSDYPLETDPYNFFADLWEKAEEKRQGLIDLTRSMKELKQSIAMMQEVQDLFVEQAGFGIAVAISLHEINKITSNFYNGIIALIRSGDYDKVKLENLKTTSESLRSELKRLSPLRSIRNEKSITFSVIKAINYAYEVFKRKLRNENIIFEVINKNDDFQLYGRYSTITQVFGNLFDNSIYWIKYGAKGIKKIAVSLNKRYRTIVFADSGSGINDIIRPNLFQPGYSLKEPPSGLGLFICKNYVDNMKGRIYETPQRDRITSLQGAQFTLEFSKSPEEAK